MEELDMFKASRAVGAFAVTLALGTVVGCGGGESLAALKDPGTQGVEALRQALRGALEKHDNRRQCELLTPALIDSNGGSVEACASRLSAESEPYRKSLGEYRAGGRIEVLGNQASYQSPPGTQAFSESEASDGSTPATVFTAVYTEGGWRVTDNGE
jgi:hypothetical protein